MPGVLPLLLACAPPPELGPSETSSTPDLAGPAHTYVLGYDPDAGRSITGASHSLVRPDARREAFGLFNQPDSLHPELSGDALRFDATLVEGETDWDVFPSSWWPMALDGIAYRWASDDVQSPIEKYDALYHPDQTRTVAQVEHWNYADLELPFDARPAKHSHPAVEVAGPATEWELVEHGVYGSVHPDGWWGHCNGWAAYATTDPLGAPDRAIHVRLDERGDVVECIGDRSGCTRFRKADLEALMAEVWFDDTATVGGLRCNTAPEDIERDELGRPVDAACRDLNPGTFHVAITTLLGRGADHLGTGEPGLPSFVIDHSWDWEVWNFPVVAYQIDQADRVDEAQATALVGGDGTYAWNDRAMSWVQVALTYWMVSDDVDAAELRQHAHNRDVAMHAVDLRYVLELDADDLIIGGEWIDTPSTWGPDSRELHPDFLWIAVDHQGGTERPNDTEGGNDNPFVSYRSVAQLVRCANEPASCAPEAPVDTGTPPPASEPPAGCGCANGGGAPSALLVAALIAARTRRRSS